MNRLNLVGLIAVLFFGPSVFAQDVTLDYAGRVTLSATGAAPTTGSVGVLVAVVDAANQNCHYYSSRFWTNVDSDGFFKFSFTGIPPAQVQTGIFGTSLKAAVSPLLILTCSNANGDPAAGAQSLGRVLKVSLYDPDLPGYELIDEQNLRPAFMASDSLALSGSTVGTGIGNIVRLVDNGGNAALPAVSGANLTNLPASALIGSVPVASVPDISAARVTSGTFDHLRYGTLPFSIFGSGTLATVQLGLIPATSIVGGASGSVTHVGTGDGLTGGNFSVTGTISLAASGVSAGSLGSASRATRLIVDTYGRLTGADDVNIAIAASQITGGTLDTARVGVINDANISGLAASKLTGTLNAGVIGTISGTSLTDIAASSITMGTFATARLGTVPDSSIEGLAASKLTGTLNNATVGIVNDANVSGLAASKLTGTLNNAQVGVINNDNINDLEASKLSGTLNVATMGVIPVSAIEGGAGLGSVTNVSAGTGLAGGNITTTGTLSLAASGVTAGSIGTASRIVRLIVDTYGRITGADEQDIALNANQLTAGTLDNARVGIINNSNINDLAASKLTGTLSSATIGVIDGSSLANIAAESIATGTLATARLGTIPDSSIETVAASKLTGTIEVARLPASGAVAQTVGSGTLIPSLTIDSLGRITAVGSSAISQPWGSIGLGINYASGSVGIGVGVPAVRLDVSGAIKIANDGAACAAGFAGAIRYNSGALEFCNGVGPAWSVLGVSGAGLQSLNALTDNNQSIVVAVSGTSAGITSATGTHTINIPMASTASATAGLLSNADYLTLTTGTLPAGRIADLDASKITSGTLANALIGVINDSNINGLAASKLTGTLNSATIGVIDGGSLTNIAAGSITSGTISTPRLGTVPDSSIEGLAASKLTGTLNNAQVGVINNANINDLAASKLTGTLNVATIGTVPLSSIEGGAGLGSVTNVSAGTGLAGGNITTTGTLSLAASGVTAGSIGTSSRVVRLIVDTYGRITGADEQDIALNANQLTTGTLNNAQVGIINNANINDLAASKLTGTLNSATIGVIDGGSLTNIAAGSITSGTLATARIGTIPDSSIEGLAASKLSGTLNNATVGIVNDSNVSGLAASKLTGTLNNAQVGVIINANINDLASSKLTGTLNVATMGVVPLSAIEGGAGLGSVTNVSAGTGLAGGNITTTGTLSLATSGVTAGSLGTASRIVRLIVDTYGRITGADEQDIALNANQLTSGTLNNAQVGVINNANINDLAAIKLTGTLNSATIGVIDGGSLTNIAAGSITGGTIATARLGTVPDSSIEGLAASKLTGTLNVTTMGVVPLSALQGGGSFGTVTQVSAGTGLAGGNITSAGTLSLATSGVTAGSLGTASRIVRLIVDTYGRITGADEQDIALNANQLTSGTLNNAQVGIINDVNISGLAASKLTGTLNQSALGSYTSPWQSNGGTVWVSGSRVGIGTSTPSPDSALAVRGTIDIQGPDSAIYAGNSELLRRVGTDSVYLIRSSNSGGITGTGNIGIGLWSLFDVTSGSDNTVVGREALRNNVTGGANIAVGNSSGNNVRNGSNNVQIGYRAGGGSGLNPISTNTAVGSYALFSQRDGGINTALGGNAGYNLQEGFGNIFLGYDSGDPLVSGGYNIFIGNQVGAPAGTVSNFMSIGNLLFSRGINGTGSSYSTGSLGVGTNTPMARLDVAGWIRSSGAGSVPGALVLAGGSTMGSGTNAIAIVAPGTVASYALVLPINVGTVGQSLTLTSTGSLGWSSGGSGTIGFPLLSTTRGSAGSPAYAFSADGSLGIFSPGVGTLAITTQGTARVSVGPTGQVRVGDAGTSWATDSLFQVAGVIRSHGTNGVGEIQLSSSSWNNKVSLRAPASLASDYQLVLPSDDGSAGQVLLTDGNGQLSWSSVGVSFPLLSTTLGAFATPAYSFAADSDTGIFSPSSGELSFVSNGSDIFRVQNGFVGAFRPMNLINSASYSYAAASASQQRPDSAANFLNIIAGANTANNASLVGMQVANTSSNLQNAYMGIVGTEGPGEYRPSFVLGLQVGANSYQERLRIDQDGNLGLGTTVVASGARLEVAGGAIRASQQSSTLGGEVQFAELRANGTNTVALRAPNALANSINWILPSVSGSPGDVLTLTSSGSLGWSTAGGGISYPLASTTRGSANSPAYSFSADTTSGLFSPGAGTVAISTNGAARIFVDDAGDVGVGSATPWERLYVEGSSGSDLGIGIRNTSSSGNSSLNFYNNGSSFGGTPGGRLYYNGTSPSDGFGANSLVLRQEAGAGGLLALSAMGSISLSINGPSNARLIVQDSKTLLRQPGGTVEIDATMRLVPRTALPFPANPGDVVVHSTDNNTFKWFDGGGWRSAGSTAIGSRGIVNIAATTYNITPGQNGSLFHYTAPGTGVVALPDFTFVSSGFEVTIARQVNQRLTITMPNGSLANGQNTIEMRGNNLASINVTKLGAYWVITQKVDDCMVGQPCWGANHIYVGTYMGKQYFTTPGGCSDSPTPTCGGIDAVTKNWGSGTDSAADSTTDGASNTSALASELRPAGQYCDAMVYAGYSDWFLPARHEFAMVIKEAGVIPGLKLDYFGTFIYWTSTEGTSATTATAYQIPQGAFSTAATKTTASLVRCLRSQQ